MQLQHLLASLAFGLPLVMAGSHSMSTLGCYSDVAGLTNVKQYTFQSQGYCIHQCATDGYKFAALKEGSTCGCSNTVPLSSAKVDDDQCDQYCAGWPEDKCGGINDYMVLTTNKFTSSGSNTNSGNSTNSGSDSESEATPTANVATTDGGIIIAATNTATATSTLVSKGITSVPSPSKSSIASAGITALSQSATPSATPNAADNLRAGRVAGVLVAGLGLLL